jgi:DNA-binding transcriptional MerR regulator
MSRQQMSLQELAKRSGVPPRTIRYYIARGLLAGPVVAGPRAYYSAEHLERIGQIRKLQQQGMTLSEIAHHLSGGSAKAVLPEPERWCHFSVTTDVKLLVKEGALSPWQMHRIRELVDQLGAVLRSGTHGVDSTVTFPQENEHDRTGDSIRAS